MSELRVGDINAAAYIVAQGQPVVRVLPGRWVCWVFSDVDGTASRHFHEWQSGMPCLVDGHSFMAAYAALRRDALANRVPA